jgi:hypothetical protein
MCTPAIPALINSRTVRIVCSGSPNPAPASASAGTFTVLAILLATRTCSSKVSSGSEVHREPTGNKTADVNRFKSDAFDQSTAQRIISDGSLLPANLAAAAELIGGWRYRRAR